jgi:protein SCO1/2
MRNTAVSRTISPTGFCFKLGLFISATAAFVAGPIFAEGPEQPPAAEVEAAHQHHHSTHEGHEAATHEGHEASAHEHHEATAHQGHDAPAEADDPHAHHRAQAVSESATRTLAAYALPDLTMFDQNGDAVSVRELLSADRPTLVNFIFTTCTAICPVMSATFAQVQRQLGDDSGKVRMVSVSIDPEQDTPEALAEYAARFEAGPQWIFLTGSLEDSIALQKAFDAYRGDKMNHAPLTLVRVGPDAQWVRYDGFASAADLVKESHAMLAD